MVNFVQVGWPHTIIIVILVIAIKLSWGVQVVERIKIAENLIYLLLLKILHAAIFVGFLLTPIRIREDHIIYKFTNPSAIGIG